MTKMGQVEAFGKAKEAWFRGFLQLPNGIPSHDTFGRVFSVLSPEVFEVRFREWVAAVREACGEDIVAIDGKTTVASLRDAHPKQGLDGAQQIGGARDGNRHQDRLQRQHKPAKALLAARRGRKKTLKFPGQGA